MSRAQGSVRSQAATDAVLNASSARRRSIGRRLRGLARYLLWSTRGRLFRNPPLPPQVRSILFVCKGNICRSPFAALVAGRLARELGMDVACSSAGLVPSSDGRCPTDAQASAARHGVSLRAHTPARLTYELAVRHDLIVAMEPGQLRQITRQWPDLRSRTLLITGFGPVPDDAYSRLNVSDPFGKGAAAFDACYSRLESSIGDLLRAIRLRG